MTVQDKKYSCLTCGAPVEKGTKFFPFCSARCKEVDLGEWAAEKFRIPVVEEENEDEIGSE